MSFLSGFLKANLLMGGLALIGMSASSPALAADYMIDTKGAHASINFSIRHLGYSWLTGRFDKFSGQFSFDEKSPGASKVNVMIDTTSVSSNHAERDKHLRSADFLDVGKFPTAQFTSSSITMGKANSAKINGKLTLHGVTRDIVIEAQLVGGGKDPWGGYRTGFTGTTTLALADYGIKKNLGPASKNVMLTLHVEGIRK